MALTESYMLALQTKAPSFSLPNVISGEIVSLSELSGDKGTLVIFMCNHCPYVVHLMDALVATASEFLNKGVQTIAISSNSIISHPQDGPEKMKSLAKEKNFLFLIYLTKLRRLPMLIRLLVLQIFIYLMQS